MPKFTHEALADLFRDHPAFTAEVLRDQFGLDLPRFDQARVDDTALADTRPTEFRADAAVTFTVAGRPVLAVIVEVQLRKDANKPWSWPVYQATLRARRRCPVILLVVCPDDVTAA